MKLKYVCARKVNGQWSMRNSRIYNAALRIHCRKSKKKSKNQK